MALPLTRTTLGARAAVTAGSALRQLGRHEDAAAVERAALRTAPPDQRAHLLIGLAADAVGLGDARMCKRRPTEAAAALPARDSRARIRLAWVRAEHAFMIGRPCAAVTLAREALARSRTAAMPRHEAKSLLFLGVALRECGRPDATKALALARDRANECGARPVARVARALLAPSRG